MDEYNNPEHYRPELPSSNRGHTGEMKSGKYYGD
ncbi:GH-E family nuclease [Selenomonas ruminantium]